MSPGPQPSGTWHDGTGPEPTMDDYVAALRARLFGFVEAGAEEEDMPTFAAALTEYHRMIERAAAHRIYEAADATYGGHVARDMGDLINPDGPVADRNQRRST